jgi:hypothetical protein
MPSTKYVDLTLGATGTSYQAPANGYYTIKKNSNTSGQYLSLVNTNTKIEFEDRNTGTTNQLRCYVLARKGERVNVYYTAGGNLQYFRFIYAEGENN